MRRITLWGLSTVAALVLLFSYRTSTVGPAGGQYATLASNGADALRDAGARTYPGSVVQTRRGPVQVSIVIIDRRIADIAVPISPTDSDRSRDLNARALPLLREQALEAQSADIDSVSGATITSDAYRESLQAAIDAAHL
jgi:uncharacterized protein with FMN-binding domain